MAFQVTPIYYRLQRYQPPAQPVPTAATAAPAATTPAPQPADTNQTPQPADTNQAPPQPASPQ